MGRVDLDRIEAGAPRALDGTGEVLDQGCDVLRGRGAKLRLHAA